MEAIVQVAERVDPTNQRTQQYMFMTEEALHFDESGLRKEFLPPHTFPYIAAIPNEPKHAGLFFPLMCGRLI